MIARLSSGREPVERTPAAESWWPRARMRCDQPEARQLRERTRGQSVAEQSRDAHGLPRVDSPPAQCYIPVWSPGCLIHTGEWFRAASYGQNAGRLTGLGGAEN